MRPADMSISVRRRARLIQWSLLPGFAALVMLMAFSTDVVGLTAFALAAISMAGTVLIAHTAEAEAD